eukprot:1149626-Pelagomonas_calceolata.AAC.7
MDRWKPEPPSSVPDILPGCLKPTPVDRQGGGCNGRGRVLGSMSETGICGLSKRKALRSHEINWRNTTLY